MTRNSTVLEASPVLDDAPPVASGVKLDRVNVQRLSPAASLVLDGMRFCAAIFVALGHYTLPAFSQGLPSFMVAASGAVGVFFVLSGFVISYVSLYRESTLTDYLVDRAARLFSVILPAMAYSIVVDIFLRNSIPERVFSPSYILSLFTTLTFSGEVWFQDWVLPTNGAFWSLSYEGFYYALYGMAFYLKGWTRVIALTAICLLGGPSILFLAPAWFFGCLVHKAYQHYRRSARQSAFAVAGLVAFGAFTVFLLKASPHAIRSRIHDSNIDFNNQMLLDWHMQRASTWYIETSVLGGVLMLAILLAVDRLPLPSKSRFVTAFRFIADGTFPLYLFHTPLLRTVRALFHYNRASVWSCAIIITAITTVSVLLGPLCNLLKDFIKAKLLGRGSAKPRIAAVLKTT